MKKFQLLVLLCSCVIFVQGQTNLTKNKSTISSNFTNTSYALDENTTTFATGAATSGIKSFIVDLGAVYDLSSIKAYFTINYSRQYRISGSINSTTFYTLLTTTGSSNVWVINTISASGIRYIKFETNIDALNYLAELREFQVFGSLSPIVFEYDNAGNRTQRRINTVTTNSSQLKKANLDSTRNEPALPEISLDNIDEYQIAVFPNPTKGNLQVKIDNLSENDKVSIMVYDIHGKLIHSYKSLPENIDLESHPNGEYLMNIFIGNNKSEWKIIKR